MIKFWHDIMGKTVVIIHAETQERKDIKVNSELMKSFLSIYEVTLQDLQVVHYDIDLLGLFRENKKREPEKTAP
ncbi:MULTISPECIES: hypothetical protein [Laceyella]|jgi:hypothetical protein|uniref:Uncharacterized protein n=1 Tax=Laceyella sediminis TaxID=573074 RepID=A0ABX5EMS3_9BACL|nr:hypothetical protein [Laceyella sediminis]MRG29286.1 hypothetical protein [Laceyella tengchongensis]PRZ13616.1 hypothetical protein CLV36_108113 [Laceyella sediminis]